MRYDVVNERQMSDLIVYGGAGYSAGDVTASLRDARSGISFFPGGR